MTCICWLHGSCPVDKPGDKHFLQPRSQGSLLPALRSVGLVGENPGNEFALSPFDTYESYNSTSNISSVLPTRHASKFLSPLNGSICPLYSSLCLKNYHFFHSYDSTTITKGLLLIWQATKFPISPLNEIHLSTRQPHLSSRIMSRVLSVFSIRQ